MKKRTVSLIITVLCAPLQILRAEEVVELSHITIPEIQEAFESGTFRSEDLVKLFLSRIEAYDEQGPKLNAVLEINERVMEIARELDAERLAQGPRSVLHGIPIVLKDNFDTYDMATTGGSPAFLGSKPLYDAFVVKKLRDAGAIIFAKVNLSGFMGTRTGTGDSMVGGQTLNPYNLLHHPGGSSGGTGVATAAWFAMGGLGTETGVSIRDPSANNAVVGIAPTEGLVSRTGVLPISFVHDRVGPMARTVTDAAAMLSVMAGIDPADLYTLKSAGHVPQNGYLEFLDKDGLHGARLGVFMDLFNEGPEFSESLAIIEKALDDLKENGAYLIPSMSLGTGLRDILSWSRSSAIENRFALDTYFRGRGPDSPIKSFAEYVAAGHYYEASKPNLLRSLDVASLDSHPGFASLMENRENLRQLTVQLMDKYKLDALVYPMKTYPAARIPTNGSRGELRPRSADNPFSSITGLPAIVVPAGYDSNGLPVALEFLGRPFSEPALIAIAYAYEQATQHRQPPASTPALSGETITIR